jgi:hypothetical protein
MYARDEQYDLDVPEAAGLGEPFPCRRLAEKCLQIGPFDGEVKILGSLDGATWPEVHGEVGDPAGDGSLVAIPMALKLVRVELVSLAAGDPPTVKLGGFLIG